MYYLFILKKSLIFKKHKPLIIHDLREVWYPIQKGGNPHAENATMH